MHGGARLDAAGFKKLSGFTCTVVRTSLNLIITAAASTIKSSTLVSRWNGTRLVPVAHKPELEKVGLGLIKKRLIQTKSHQFVEKLKKTTQILWNTKVP
jgi:hypothetical protein